MVHFVGAGSGAVDLITVRGAKLLGECGIGCQNVDRHIQKGRTHLQKAGGDLGLGGDLDGHFRMAIPAGNCPEGQTGDHRMWYFS